MSHKSTQNIYILFGYLWFTGGYKHKYETLPLSAEHPDGGADEEEPCGGSDLPPVVQAFL